MFCQKIMKKERKDEGERERRKQKEGRQGNKKSIKKNCRHLIMGGGIPEADKTKTTVLSILLTPSAFLKATFGHSIYNCQFL